MLLTVKLSAAGAVAVSGSAVKTLKKSMAAGQRQLTLTLTKAGTQVGQASPQAEPAGDPHGRQTDGLQDHEREAVSALARMSFAPPPQGGAGGARAGSAGAGDGGDRVARPRRASRGRNRAPTPPCAPNRASPKAPPTRCPACRAYELASPPLKNEQEVNVPDRFVAEASFQAAEQGGGDRVRADGRDPRQRSRGACTATPSRRAPPREAPGAPDAAGTEQPPRRAARRPARTPANSSPSPVPELWCHAHPPGRTRLPRRRRTAAAEGAPRRSARVPGRRRSTTSICGGARTNTR